ncbi:MAG: hypothetical protein MUF22_02400 [Chitinispirillaceae bacterium]|jgi:hypothetical protein|nr:hypothetical protein [Chitinispirillaceae bacterium]
MMSAHTLLSAFFIVILAGCSLADSRMSSDVIRPGRSISLDGLLMEWTKNNRVSWDKGWNYDAVATPEGLAGYFLATAPACTSWIFQFEANGVVRQIAPSVAGEFYRVSRPESGTGMVIEWVIPDSAMRISGLSKCGDTLRALTLISRGAVSTRSNLLSKGILIGVLLLFFAGLQMQIRRMNRRTRSPRRSA